MNDKEISVPVWTLVANMADFGLTVLRYSGRRSGNGRYCWESGLY